MTAPHPSVERVYVSLTSIFANQRRVARALQSILDQTRRPDRIFLHLSEHPHLRDEGFSGRRITEPSLLSFLERHRDRVEVCWVENTGPYRKLLPLLAEVVRGHERVVIVTVDDDLEYDSGVIAALLDCGAPASCLRAFAMEVDDPAHLGSWGYFRRTRVATGTSLTNFSTGVGGVLYRPEVFEGLFDVLLDPSIYLECCPTNDDIWFNFLRIANRVAMTAVDAPYVRQDLTNKKTSLWENFNGAGNNSQIRETAARLRRLSLI